MFDNASIVAKVYSKGSLRNNANGFEFTLYNRIDTGTLAGIKSLSIDGFDVPANFITLQTPEGIWPAQDVTFSNPVAVRVGMEARLIINGMPLAPGQHHIVITLSVLEVGRVQLKISDDL